MIILSIIIFILLCIIIVQYIKERKRSENLRYIKNKLNQITHDKTEEKVLVVECDNEIRELLTEINKLIECNKKNLVSFREKEISMKKMLSNISHDLKTPLTVILGYIETLKTKNIEEREKEMLLTRVYDKTLEMTHLINKFFDLSKLESGDKEIPIKRINMNEIARKNILSFYDTLEDKKIEVNIDIPNENIYALCNEEAIDRIFNNLISNAIKYGYEGGIIGINLTYDEEYVYIEVFDKGKGICETKWDKVFERMYTLEDSRNKDYEGSGLGLTITKRLVESMGGTISLKSKPYVKTSFIIKLQRVNY